MKYCIALLAMFALPASKATQAPAVAEKHEVVTEVGYVPMHGMWYQDNLSHVHDKEVKIGQRLLRDGGYEVTLGTGLPSGTDLRFVFSHDERRATAVFVTGTSRSDVRLKGSPDMLHVDKIEGHVLVKSNDWGPGKDIQCVFALRGIAGKRPQILTGSFLVLLPD